MRLAHCLLQPVGIHPPSEPGARAPAQPFTRAAAIWCRFHQPGYKSVAYGSEE